MCHTVRSFNSVMATVVFPLIHHKNAYVLLAVISLLDHQRLRKVLNDLVHNTCIETDFTKLFTIKDIMKRT